MFTVKKKGDRMLKKIVAIEPVSLNPAAVEELGQYAGEVCIYNDIPGDDREIIRRIGDGDGVLVSYTSRISAKVIESCPSIRYIGMCCSLYSEESANVDISCAGKHGITVKGVRDYGDRGVVEFAVSELVRFLHGFDRPMFREMPLEITDLKVGILGMGVTGGMIAEAMKFMGARVSYYSRTRKPDQEALGMAYRPLRELLESSEVVFACLNKNVILLGEEEFKCLGRGKILFNTSIGPAFEIAALGKWLDQEGCYFVCDTQDALGDAAGELLKHPRVACANVPAGRSVQSFDRLSRKVLDNIRAYLSIQ